MKIIFKFTIKDAIKGLYWRLIDEKDKEIKFTAFVKHAKKFDTLQLAEDELVNLPKGVYEIDKLYKV